MGVPVGADGGGDQAAELRDREEFRAAFEQAAVGMLYASLDGRLVRVNARFAELLGYTQAELVGHHFLDLTHPSDRETNAEFAVKLASGEIQAHTTEKRYLHRGGAPIWVNVAISLRRGPDGTPLQLMAVVEDIRARKAAEEALRESEERLRLALKAADAIAFVWDLRADTLVRHISEEPALPMNVGNAEAMSRVKDRVHPDDRDGFERRLSECLASGNDYTNLARFLRPDGSYRWLSARGSIERYPGGTPLRLTGVAVDVTELQSSRVALSASDERLRLAILATNDAIWDLDVASGQVTRSERWSALFGSPPDPAPYDWWRSQIHPDDRERVVRSFQRSLAGTDTFWTADYRFLKGSTWAEVHDRAYISRDAEGRAHRVVGALLDVTTQRQAAAALALRDRALHAVTQGIIIIEVEVPENRTIYVSPSLERLTGFGSDEVVGGGSGFMLGPETDVAAVAQVREAHRAGQGITIEIRFHRKDGSSFWCGLSTSPVLDANGKATHFVGVLTDLTARRALEEQLRESQKMDAIGRLAGGVAHDFNNLLTVIGTECEILLEDQPEDGPCRPGLSAIRDAGERAAELTAQLLAFSRKAIVEPKVLELNRAVETSTRLLSRVIGEDIRLNLRLSEGHERVRIDPGQLEQVLMNLVVNARDAMPSGGTVTIETRAAGAELLEIYVSDSGTGMSEEVRGQIFEPFFTTKAVGQGTGLGLATVYGIVRQAGGTIEVDSQLGRGTTFCVRLPRVSDAVERTPETRQGSRRGNETILLAEDEPVVRRLVATSLRQLGYTVLEADGGITAQRVAAEHQGTLDLLVTDVVMPDVGGRALAEALRHSRPGLKVLFMSGYTNDALVRQGIEASRVAFIHKPFTPRALAEKIREVLESSGPSALAEP